MAYNNYDRQSLDLYLKDILNYKVLTTQEERDLFITYNESKCPIAFEKIIKHNLRFVYQIARTYIEWKALSLNDLIEEGNMGLIKSIETYDVTKGYKFITHAVHWIRRYIINAMCNNKSNVRIPWNIHNSSHTINKELNKQEAQDGTVDIQKVSEASEISVNEINNINKYMSKQVRFDSPVSNEDGASTIIDMFIPNDAGRDEYENQHNKEILNAIFSKMNEREVEILKDVFGIDREYPLSKDIVAKNHGLTVVRINQLMNESCMVMKFIAKEHLKISNV